MAGYRDFERPRSAPGLDRIEWLEYWATPSGKAWARSQAIKRLKGVKAHGQSFVVMRNRFYREALVQWVNQWMNAGKSR
jgi:hypothetical protein